MEMVIALVAVLLWMEFVLVMKRLLVYRNPAAAELNQSSNFNVGCECSAYYFSSLIQGISAGPTITPSSSIKYL